MTTKLLCVLLLPCFTNCFFVARWSTTGAPIALKVILKQSSSNSWNFGEEDSSFDVEAERRRLETLVGAGGTASCTTLRSSCELPPPPPSAAISPPLDVVLPPPPLMTSADRSRRLTERALLSQLKTGDEALSDLWDFWFQERGAAAATLLERAEQLTGEGPDSWDEAEELLASLMEEHGVYWAEPVNRLATLYYVQERLEEAETLCQLVLAVKPWHFGALSLIVMVNASLHNSERARQWASRRLPTFSTAGLNKRRDHWVKTALEDSQAALENGEQRIREWMGSEDDYQSLNSVWQ